MDRTAAFVGAIALAGAYEYTAGRQIWWGASVSGYPDVDDILYGPRHIVSLQVPGYSLFNVFDNLDNLPDDQIPSAATADALAALLYVVAAAAAATVAAKQMASKMAMGLTALTAAVSAAAAIVAVVLLVDVEDSLATLFASRRDSNPNTDHEDPSITAAGVVHGVLFFVVAMAALVVVAAIDLKGSAGENASTVAVVSMAVSGLMLMTATSYHFGYHVWFKDGNVGVGPKHIADFPSGDHDEVFLECDDLPDDYTGPECTSEAADMVLLVLPYLVAAAAFAVGVADMMATRAAAAAFAVALAVTSVFVLADISVGTLEVAGGVDGVLVYTIVAAAYAALLSVGGKGGFEMIL
jgi:hypothetical protein